MLNVWNVVLVVTATALAGCPSDDPHDAPGCEQASRRCDEDVLQVCVIDASRREWVWVDVIDCTELDDTVCKQNEDDEGRLGADCLENTDAGAAEDGAS